MFVLVLLFAGTLAVGSPVSGSADVSENVPCVQNDTCTLYPSGCDGKDKLCCYYGFSMNCFCCFSTTTIDVTVTSFTNFRTTTIEHNLSTTIQTTSSTLEVETSTVPSYTSSTVKVTTDYVTKAVTVEAPSSVVIYVVCSLSAIVCMFLLVLTVVLWQEPVWRMRFLFFFCSCLVKQQQRNRNGSALSHGFLNCVENWLNDLSNQMDRTSDRSSVQTEITEVNQTNDALAEPEPTISESSASESHFERFPDAIEIEY
jgi:hypothetical protein